MQHLANLVEDNSYSAKERNKFAGWYKKWTEARILLMVCLSLEVLQPAKLLSETFQNKNVDMVDIVTYISQTKKQLKRIERKDFESLPTIRCFLNSVKEEEEKHLFQDVKLKGFDIAKTIVSSKKNVWLELVKNAISERLKNNKTIASKYCALILNTEGWLHFKDNDEFADEALEELYIFYEKPLKLSGFNGSISDILQQWYLLLEYVLTYLSSSINLNCIV